MCIYIYIYICAHVYVSGWRTVGFITDLMRPGIRFKDAAPFGVLECMSDLHHVLMLFPSPHVLHKLL